MIGLSGCWYAAIQLAPVALSAVVRTVEGAVMLAHHGSAPPHEDLRPGEDEGDRRDRCEQLQVEVPGVIELHKNAAGVPEYRELSLGGSLDDGRWMTVVDSDTAADGWRPAVNFLQMNFAPPLDGALSGTEIDYLAYAPAKSESLAEQERIAALTTNFGTAVGTFNWSGRVYQYALTHTLPCFPPPT
jgi:hypothetical protein